MAKIQFIPLDLTFRDDPKIRKLRHYIDNDADIIFIEIFMAIFRGGSFYIHYFSDFLEIIALERKNWNLEKVKKVFTKCLELDLINKDLYEKYGILTSKGIQTRFFYIAEKSK